MARSRTTISLLVLSSALLASTAGVFAQDAGAPVFTLSGSGGVSALNIPTYDTGVFGHTAGGMLFGGMIGGKITGKIGELQDWDVIGSFSTFGTFAGGSSSWTDTFTASDSAVVVDGSDDSRRERGHHADARSAVATSADVTGSDGGSANTSAGGGATNNVAAVTPDGTGFVGSSVVTTASTGAAYGAIGSSSGGIFMASGDIDGLSITTDVQRFVAYGGADLTLGLAGHYDSNTNVQVYAGPSFRGLGEGAKTDISINIPEAQPSVLTHPLYTITVNDTLTSYYFGGVVGGNVSIATQSGVTYTLGAEGGLYSVNASWSGHDTYSTCCGSIGTPISSTSPDISVDGPTSTHSFGSSIAYAARANASASWAIEGNKTFTLGGNIDYLSKVATVDHSGLTQTGAWLSTDRATGTLARRLHMVGAPCSISGSPARSAAISKRSSSSTSQMGSLSKGLPFSFGVRAPLLFA